MQISEIMKVSLSVSTLISFESISRCHLRTPRHQSLYQPPQREMHHSQFVLSSRLPSAAHRASSEAPITEMKRGQRMNGSAESETLWDDQKLLQALSSWGVVFYCDQRGFLFQISLWHFIWFFTKRWFQKLESIFSPFPSYFLFFPSSDHLDVIDWITTTLPAIYQLL